MSTLCTFPGRNGDLLWALPTVRALSHRIGEPIHLHIAGEFADIARLIAEQPYIAGVVADQNWAMTDAAPPKLDIGISFNRIFNLGYRGWPEPDVVTHTRVMANSFGFNITHEDLCLSAPWIELSSGEEFPAELAIAFSETYFELKVGMIMLLVKQIAARRPISFVEILAPEGSRYKTDTVSAFASIVAESDWLTYAKHLCDVRVALCCNSGAHVLAVAMGIPVVMMEPMEARHNPIFFPVGDSGPQVTLVKGNDGKPTTDVRHVADLILEKLNATP